MATAGNERSTEQRLGGVREARERAAKAATELGAGDVAGEVALVVSELVTNAELHAAGCLGVDVTPIEGGVRVAVRDGSRAAPLVGRPSDRNMTGRGMQLVAGLSRQWGVELTSGGKTVWADVTGESPTSQLGSEDLLDLWDDDFEDDFESELELHRIELGEVSTEFLLAAKAHVDNLVREFELILAGQATGVTSTSTPHLERLLTVIRDRFAEARLAVKGQALRAAHRGESRTNLVLELPLAAADAGEEYLAALDELDDYCRAMRLFTLETEPEHRVFRRWYVGEIVSRLRAEASGEHAGPAQTFEERILDDLRALSESGRAADRAARLYRLARALAVSATPEEVAAAVLDEGVAALGADAGGLLLEQREDRRLALPGAVGYDERALSLLRHEPRDAELPAARALRTGETVWLETREERDAAYPEMSDLEPTMEALCAVPLAVGQRRLGALRFSFRRPRVFDEDERRFVIALADQTAQALDRAQLQSERIEASRRLQRSLLPPELPTIPGVELAAVHHPLGEGNEVGGDFYDAWDLGDGRWAVAIGDACGMGPEAAALTSLVRHSLRALSLLERRPGEVMRLLNSLLTSAAPAGSEAFCTALFGVVTAGGNEIVVDLAGGGHPDPLVRSPDGTRPLPVGGSLLGVFADAEVAERRASLEPGSILVLLTDGLLEARDEEGLFFEVGAIEEIVDSGHRSADSVAAAVESAVLDHCNGLPQDDMAIVVLRVPPDR